MTIVARNLAVFLLKAAWAVFLGVVGCIVFVTVTVILATMLLFIVG